MKIFFLITLMTGFLWLVWSAQSEDRSSTNAPALPPVSILLGGIGTLLLLRSRN
jgi:nitrogen fixation-related uncharacterized protein